MEQNDPSRNENRDGEVKSDQDLELERTDENELDQKHEHLTFTTSNTPAADTMDACVASDLISDNRRKSFTSKDEGTNKEILGSLFTQVFHNEVIWKKIASYLDILEFKRLGQITPELHALVRKSPRFQNNSTHALETSKCTEIVSPLENLEYVWKHVEFDVSTMPVSRSRIPPQCPRMQNRLQRRLSTAESVYIHAQNVKEIFTNSTHESNTLQKSMAIETILSSVPNVKNLTLSVGVLRGDLVQVLSKQSVQNCFKRLKELHLVTTDLRTTHYVQDQYGICRDPPKEQTPFTKNILALADTPTNLEAFTLGNLGSGYQKIVYLVLLELIKKSSQTLIRLSLGSWPKDFLERLKTLTFPKLTSLKLGTGNENGFLVSSLLSRLDHLVNLELTFPLEFPSDILRMIKDRRWKLKRLSLHCGIRSSQRRGAPETNWNTLWGMSVGTLEEFELIIAPNSGAWVYYYECYHPELEMDYKDVFWNLPNTMKRINLRGLNAMTLTPILEEFERFTNLTELSLLNNYNMRTGENFDLSIGNDELLQRIFLDTTKLRILRLSNSDQITDFGLTGVKSYRVDQCGVSIQNLKSLRQLVIVNCPKITDAGLVLGIEFSDLRLLHLVRSRAQISGNSYPHNVGPEIKTSAWKQIVKQNSRLTIIILRSKRNMAEELKAVNSSVQRVYNTYKRTIKQFDQRLCDSPSSKYYEDIFTDTSADRD